MRRSGRCGCQRPRRSGLRGSDTATLLGSRWVEPWRCSWTGSCSACSVNTLPVSGRCLLSKQSTNSRIEKPGSKPENTGSIPTRHGCVKGVRDCGVGKLNSRLESYGQSLRQRSRRVTRRATPRSGETTDAPAGQASSTSAATAWLAAEHNAGYGRGRWCYFFSILGVISPPWTGT